MARRSQPSPLHTSVPGLALPGMLIPGYHGVTGAAVGGSGQTQGTPAGTSPPAAGSIQAA